MLFFSESELIKLAIEESDMKQAEFARVIGKSQAQVSKYLSGSSKPPDDIIIRCMNIVVNKKSDKSNLLLLLFEISKLGDDHHREMRAALLSMITAYKGRAKLAESS